MKKFFLFLLCNITLIFPSLSQDLATDRPGLTQSAECVPQFSLLWETAAAFEFIEDEQTEVTHWAINNSLLRFGILKGTEARLGFGYESIEFMDKYSSISSAPLHGFSSIMLGLKTELTKEGKVLPAMAILSEFYLPYTGSATFSADYLGVKLALAVSKKIRPWMYASLNTGLTWDGAAEGSEGIYSLKLKASPAKDFWLFAEFFGSVPEKGHSAEAIDGGLSYYINSKLQFDLSAGLFLRTYKGYFVSAGISARLLK